MLSASVMLAGCAESPGAERAPGGATVAPLNLPDFKSAAWTAPAEIESITDVYEMPGGSIAVTDVAEPAVYLLDSLGQSPRRIGRKGSGPGEYLEPRRVTAYVADSALIIDRRQGRYLVVDREGGIVRTEALPPDAVASANTMMGDGRGRLFFPKNAFLFDSVAAALAPLRRFAIGSSVIDSIAALRPVTVTRAEHKSADGRTVSFSSTVVPFSLEDDWAVASDGAVALVRAAPYRIDWILPDGSIVTGPAMTFEPIAVTAADREGWESSPIPPTKPPFVAGSSITDPFGRVWVRHYAPSGAATRRWSLFDRAGALVTTIEFPDTATPVHAGTRGVYVVRRDSDDLERLELHRWKQGGS